MAIKLIAGIGNIGVKYINTRHNYGSEFIQLLAKTYNVKLIKNDSLLGYIGELKIRNFIVRLLIPNNYMNNSGLSVSKCVDFYQLSLKEILIAHDELDLNPGIIKIKLGKKNNESHHGIQNIINKLNNNFDFYRLRIGIGRPNNHHEVINFVLSQPSIFEKNKIYNIMNQVILYTEDMVFGNFMSIMNKLHSF